MLRMDVTVIRPGGGATRLCVYEQQRRRDVNTWRIGFGREIPMGRPDSGVAPRDRAGRGITLGVACAPGHLCMERTGTRSYELGLGVERWSDQYCPRDRQHGWEREGGHDQAHLETTTRRAGRGQAGTKSEWAGQVARQVLPR